MVVQIVRFQLAGIGPGQYEAHAEQIAPAFARLPGLIAKAWLADADEDTVRRRLPLDRPRRGRGLRGRRAARSGPPEPGLRRLPLVDRRYPRCSDRGDRARARRPIRREGDCVDLRGWDRRSARCSTGRRLGSSAATASGPLCCASSATTCRLPCSSTASPAWASPRCSRRSLRTRVSVAPLSCPWTRARSSRRNEASSTRSLPSSAASRGPLAQVAAALRRAGDADRARDRPLRGARAAATTGSARCCCPSVPDTSRLLLAGRDEPVSAWPSALGDLFEPLPLGNLRRDESEELLRRAGVAPADAARIDRIARGHPLSLRLSAAALANRPDLDLESLATGAVVDELTRIYLAGLDRETRRALDAASVVRRPTRALLAAMLDGDDADLSTRPASPSALRRVRSGRARPARHRPRGRRRLAEGDRPGDVSAIPGRGLARTSPRAVRGRPQRPLARDRRRAVHARAADPARVLLRPASVPTCSNRPVPTTGRGSWRLRAGTRRARPPD